ncbi:MAG: LamG-like jellyroll fold domain-containing protein [Planctomycetaceae bacterium]
MGRTFLLAILVIATVSGGSGRVWAEFRAGAAVVDVTPRTLPAIVNGGMLSRSLSVINTRLHARALVLDDGQERLAIVVVDSCMMPRPLLDDAKAEAAKVTKIAANRMLISATHTHSAASCMGALGTDADPDYPPYLVDKLVEAIQQAEANLESARVGWGSVNAAEYTALRRWIRRPDRIAEDPFGNMTLRANMHAGRVWDDVTGESGPEDPDLTLISVQSVEGRPLAVLANFSMHYFSDRDISADYFGHFCEGLKARLTPEDANAVGTANNTDPMKKTPPPFVGIMSHGCSGDIWRRDYTKPAPTKEEEHTIETYANGLLDLAMKAYQEIEYTTPHSLAMAEQRMTLNYRTPDRQRLEWGQRIVDEMAGREPKTTTEVYAREQVILHELKSTEIVVQALRIGDIVIATTPNETYALTGLKLKLQSPLAKTMVIELANGGDGYIPPPEQHDLGGYNTWAARSAGLEVQAEPKIAETALQLIERVAGKPRKVYQQSSGPAVDAIRELNPVAYYRLDEFAAPEAIDSSGEHHDGVFERGVVFFLEGPRSDIHCLAGETNRAAHFAGGRLRTRHAELGNDYSVSLWFWNGMPHDAREISGWMFSRGRDHILDPTGDHVGIAGVGDHAGKLVYQQGTGEGEGSRHYGKTELKRWEWNHLLFVRKGAEVTVTLNGAVEPELTIKAPANFPAGYDRLFFGGRCDNQSNWEGRLDEIAIFPRALPTTSAGSLHLK